jgi:hypothetical protein
MVKKTKPTRSDYTEAAAADLVPVQFVVHEPFSGAGAIIVLLDGSFRLIIRTGAVNFEMKSHEEKTAIVGVWAEMMDSLSLDLPLQFVSHPKQLNTEAYALRYAPMIENERFPSQRRALAHAHVQHFEETVKMQNLLNRELYIVLPFKGNVGPISESFTDQLPFGALFRALSTSIEKRAPRRIPTDEEIAFAQQQLDLSAEILELGLHRIGIERVQRLGEDEVRELLDDCFNPGRSQQYQTATAASPRVLPSARRRRQIEPPKEDD